MGTTPAEEQQRCPPRFIPTNWLSIGCCGSPNGCWTASAPVQPPIHQHQKKVLFSRAASQHTCQASGYSTKTPLIHLGRICATGTNSSRNEMPGTSRGGEGLLLERIPRAIGCPSNALGVRVRLPCTTSHSCLSLTDSYGAVGARRAPVLRPVCSCSQDPHTRMVVPRRRRGVDVHTPAPTRPRRGLHPISAQSHSVTHTGASHNKHTHAISAHQRCRPSSAQP